MERRSTGRNRSTLWPRAALVALVVLASTGIGLHAQLPNPASKAWQFDITGVLQAATLTSPGNPMSGGTVTVNGHIIVVPANTIVILPASSYTFQELFTQSPAPYTGNATGLAQADNPVPMTTYEVHVIGNALNGTYIAGLIDIAQNGLMQGQGYINTIDLATGEIFVGSPAQAGGNRTNSARVRLNDPVGRFGRLTDPLTTDIRFAVDSESPTIVSGTGFPMCLPRSAADDLCPQTNRPADAAQIAGFSTLFEMNFPGNATLDPLKQAPLEVGDYVTYAGILVHDGANPTAGPLPAGTATFISAFSIDDNIAIYTKPGVNPAYVNIEVAIIGTGGVTIPGAGEAADRMKVEGMTTDASRIIHLYALDYNADGSAVQRDWGRIGVDPGAAGGVGAVKGRWRYRPPCLNTLPTVNECTPPAAGVFVPAPREVRAVLEGAFTEALPLVAANGLVTGQYHAPIDEYIFPENIPGTVVPPNNFETLQFLAYGGYSSVTGVVAAGQLNPWPGDFAPPARPNTPRAVISAIPNPVGSNGVVALSGLGSTGTGALSFTWTASAGTILLPFSGTTDFRAPVVVVATPVTITLTVSDSNGIGTATQIINVNPPAAPGLTVSAPLDRTVVTGTTVSYTGTCADPNGLACTITWTQVNAGVIDMPVMATQTGTSLSFTPTLGFGVSAKTMRIQAIATNSAGISSSPVTMNVTVNPIADVVTLTAVEYRVGKQRLSLTATSSVISPKVVLTMDPYVSAAGNTVVPGAVGILLNNGGGLYTLDLVGFPEPRDVITVRSSLGGAATRAVTRLR